MHLNLKIGSLLLRKKGFVEHTGIYIGQGKVVHTVPETGVDIVSYEKFANNKDVKVIRVEHLDVETLSSRIKMIFSGDTTYSLISRNCQHIAHYLIHGKSNSSQLNWSAAGAGMGAFYGLVSGKNIWVSTIIGGLTACLLYSATLKTDETLLANTATT